MKPIVFSLALALSLQASEATREAYLKLIQDHPSIIQPLGSISDGEIQIITDPEQMASIEKNKQREVGLVYQDHYFMLINDACVFPCGSEGVYGRVVWTKSLEGIPGVAVMPILPDGKIALNCNYRHATRSWEIELPRGGLNSGETPEEGAKREVLEETGMEIDALYLLGSMPPDSGLTSTIVPIFAAKVTGKQDATPEESEAIEQILSLSVDEIKRAFANGYLDCTIRGEKLHVAFRDPFLAYALLIYGARLDR